MRISAMLLLLAASITVHAQTTADAIKARLIGKPLYLKGQWSGEALSFDAKGNAINPPPAITFTLAGMDVTKVQLKSNKLLLSGMRVGLEFLPAGVKRVRLKKADSTGQGTIPVELKIEVEAPQDGDYTKTLDSIFFTSLDQIVPQLPPFWKLYGQEHLLSDPPAKPLPRESSIKPENVGRTVQPPKLLMQKDASYTESARALLYNGDVLVSLEVDAEGKPQNVAVARPAGLGLDEAAIVAVRQYLFQPAIKNGAPVAVRLNIAVNFKIY
jgi:TonB family protein